MPGPFGTNPVLERQGNERNYWLYWREGEDAYANGDLFPRVRPVKSAWAEINERKKALNNAFFEHEDGDSGGYQHASSPADSAGRGALTTPMPLYDEKERVAHMSDKLMKATMGKIFERETGEEAHGHSPPAEIHPAVTHGDDHGGNGSHRPVMAFGRRVSEDSGRAGWAYGHHNNQVKDGVIYGDTLLSVKTGRVIDHLHTGGAHIQRRAPTKKDTKKSAFSSPGC